MKEVNIYTYTNFRGLQRQDGKGVYLLEMKLEGKEPATLHETLEIQNATPNEAELKTLVEALSRMRQKSTLNLHTDSFYISSGYGWVQQWKENGWKTSKGEDVSNRRLWERLDALMQGHAYTFITGKPHEYRAWLKNEAERRNRQCMSDLENLIQPQS